MDQIYEKLLKSTYKYLSFRPRSEKEIRDYLKKKKADSQTSQRIIDLLNSQKFLNDEEFARIWAESRSKNKAWRVVKMELRQKGISEELIEGLKFNSNNDFQGALSLAQKRVERLKNESFQKQKEKLFRLLSSKGFEYDTIKQVVDQVLRQ